MEAKKQTNLLRHLWLLRFPGLLAAVLVVTGLVPGAILWLCLEAWLVACALLAAAWIPAEALSDLPRPRYSTANLLQLCLYLIAGAAFLAVVWLALMLTLERRARIAERWAEGGRGRSQIRAGAAE